MEKLERLKWLTDEVNKHNKNYYVYDNPTISDAEYDEMRAMEADGYHPSIDVTAIFEAKSCENWAVVSCTASFEQAVQPMWQIRFDAR